MTIPDLTNRQLVDHALEVADRINGRVDALIRELVFRIAALEEELEHMRSISPADRCPCKPARCIYPECTCSITSGNRNGEA